MLDTSATSVSEDGCSDDVSDDTEGVVVVSLLQPDNNKQQDNKPINKA